MKMYFKISMVLAVLVTLFTPAKAGRDDFKELEFNDVVRCLRERKTIEVKGEEYLVLKEHPKLKSDLYNGKKVATNPCYPGSCGLGPALLRLSDIVNLPQDANFFLHSVNQDPKGKYFTIGYTSTDNPHWELMYTFPEPFKEPANRYWHDEHTTDCVQIIRTVNFLLQKVDAED